MGEQVLVTGGSGFLGMRIIAELLRKGYQVRTTVRTINKRTKIIETLQKNGYNTAQLTFMEADLSKDKNWEAAMHECKYVLSVASPVFFDQPKDEDAVIKPAQEGILRILKAAKKSNVQRVVMTSNFGAVGFSNFDKTSVTTEEDWTNPNQKGLSLYEKSKLLAEKAAWAYVNQEAKDLEFATVNPVAIFGPSLDEHVSGSFDVIKHILDGSMSRLPNIALNVVDVRDVAAIHVLAMEKKEANRKRFIASADGQITMPEIAALLMTERPEISQRVSDKRIPNFILNLASHFNQQAREGKLLLDINRNVSNLQAKDILGWQPISSQENAILKAADSLDKYGLLK